MGRSNMTRIRDDEMIDMIKEEFREGRGVSIG